LRPKMLEPDSVMGAAARLDHGDQMDAIYGIQRHFYDLTRKYYLLGRDQLIRDLAMADGDSALEIGCGTGRNLALAGRHFRRARLHGLDISQEMLKSAEAKLAGRIASGAIHLARADATDFDAGALFGRTQFDRVWFSYTLSMIPDWRAALAQGMACVAPGGALHIVDFGQQAGLPRWFRSLLQAWLARFHVTPRAALIGACEQLAAEQGWAVAVERPWRDYAWRIVLRRP
jgi:S-adenosylmethionine-diacylgycerolhomoserine-N-methlytransferase